MIDIETVVKVVLLFLALGAVFGLLLWLIGYCEREFPGFPIFFKAARILLVILAVLVIIAFILEVIGHPIIRWGPRPLG